jgi:hypothetical protein
LIQDRLFSFSKGATSEFLGTIDNRLDVDADRRIWVGRRNRDGDTLGMSNRDCR